MALWVFLAPFVVGAIIGRYSWRIPCCINNEGQYFKWLSVNHYFCRCLRSINRVSCKIHHQALIKIFLYTQVYTNVQGSLK